MMRVEAVGVADEDVDEDVDEDADEDADADAAECRRGCG